MFGAYNSYGYGYLIWKAPRNGFALIGMADQLAICDPETDFIFIINSENMDYSKTTRAIIYHELYKSIVDGFDTVCYVDKTAQSELCEYLSTCRLICLDGDTSSPLAENVNGVRYMVEPNDMGTLNIELGFKDSRVSIGMHSVFLMSIMGMR